MTKTTIKKRLQKAAGGAEFITRGEIRKALGCGQSHAETITKDLDYIKFERTQRYDVDEVAQKIFENTVRVAL